MRFLSSISLVEKFNRQTGQWTELSLDKEREVQSIGLVLALADGELLKVVRIL